MHWLLILLLVSGSALAEKQTPHRIRVTPDHDDVIGYQQTTEMNIYQGSVYLNEFLEYETSNDFTFGLYVNNIPVSIYKYRQTYTYDTYLGFSKWWGQRGSVRFGVSSQIGSQLMGTSMLDTHRNFLAMSVAQIQFTPFENFTVSLGPYYANPSISTVGNRIGVAINVGWRFNKFSRLEASWYSGNTNISGAVVNYFFKVMPQVEVYLGLQVPATESGNEFAGNLGIVMPLDGL